MVGTVEGDVSAAMAFLVCLVILLLYALGILLIGWLRVKGAPREPMMMCPVHGFIREAHCIWFAGVANCPRCFHANLSGAVKRNADKAKV